MACKFMARTMTEGPSAAVRTNPSQLRSISLDLHKGTLLALGSGWCKRVRRAPNADIARQ